MPRANTPDFSDVQTVAASARVASGSSASLASGARGDRGVTCVVNVTAVTGTTPTMTLTLEESLDGTVWAPLATSAPVNAAGVVALRYVGPHGPNVRLSWAIAGTTPSFTFSHRIISS